MKKVINRKRTLSVLIFTLLMLSFGSVEQIFACSCVGKQPVCEAFGNSDAVFVGKVVGAKKEIPNTDENGVRIVYGYQEIYFQISESIYGTPNKSNITLFSEYTTCDYSFEMGKSYLVYAYGETDKLRTSICSRTRSMSQVAKEELQALRKLAKNINGTNISGSYELLGQLGFEPITAAKIKLQSTQDKSKIFETLTDNYGKYNFAHIPIGSYKFFLNKPDNTKFSSQYFDIKVSGKGCEIKKFSITNNSTFAGKLVDKEGNPVKDVSVEFISTANKFSGDFANLSAWTDTTDDEGNFSFENLGIGNYFLAVNFKEPPNEYAHFPTVIYPNTTLPSQATTFNIKRGQKLDGIIFTVPKPLKEITIKGKIKRGDGKLPIDTEIRLRDIQKDQICCFTTANEDGTFEINGYEGRKYVFEIGEVSSEAKKASDEFVLKENLKDFNLTLIEDNINKVSNRK